MTKLPPDPSEEEIRLESQLKELLEKVHSQLGHPFPDKTSH